MYCKNCGNEIKNGEKFCRKCGTVINGNIEITSQKRSIKLLPFFIGICAVVLCVTIGLMVKGKSDDLPLLEQLEKKYDIIIPEIQAAGGSAVGNVVLEDYLPYEGYQRFTTIVNSQTGEENVSEEMTMYVQNGRTVYKLYSHLTESAATGVLERDESGEYYYTVQENPLLSGVTNTEIYVGLPEKTWSIQKNEDTKKIFIAPEFYTVTTPHGTFENCLLKYEYTTGNTASWANNNTFTAYAPYGVGKIYSVTYLEESPTETLTYYTYIPDTTTASGNSIGEELPDAGMIIQDLLDDEGVDFWTGGNNNETYTLAMRLEGEAMHIYMFDPITYAIPYSGSIYDSDSKFVYVDGDAGCREGRIFYQSDTELELIIGDDIYQFYIE